MPETSTTMGPLYVAILDSCYENNYANQCNILLPSEMCLVA